MGVQDTTGTEQLNFRELVFFSGFFFENRRTRVAEGGCDRENDIPGTDFLAKVSWKSAEKREESVPSCRQEGQDLMSFPDLSQKTRATVCKGVGKIWYFFLLRCFSLRISANVLLRKLCKNHLWRSSR